MRIGRTIPPAASPIYITDIFNGVKELFTGNPDMETLRSELKDYFDVKHCYLISSGKAALTIILEALHDLYPERDEVIIPAFTCYSVPSAIVRAGLKVGLCDVDCRSLDFDHRQLEKILQDSLAPKSRHTPKINRILAVLPTHLFGLRADVVRIRDMAASRGIHVVEDAAQVFGTEYNGRKLGTFGDVAFTSLGRGKALSAVEGGVILTNRDDLARRIENRLSKVPPYRVLELAELVFKAIALIVFQYPRLFWFPVLLPFLKIGDTFYDPHFEMRKFSAFQAGLLKNWRGKLDAFKKKRLQNSKRLSGYLARHPLLRRYIADYTSHERSGDTADRTVDDKDVSLTKINPFVRFPVRILDKNLWETIVKAGRQNGLGIAPTYPDSINKITDLKSQFKNQTYADAEKLPRQLLTFPVHPFVTEKDFDRSTGILKKLAEKHALAQSVRN